VVTRTKVFEAAHPKFLPRYPMNTEECVFAVSRLAHVDHGKRVVPPRTRSASANVIGPDRGVLDSAASSRAAMAQGRSAIPSGRPVMDSIVRVTQGWVSHYSTSWSGLEIAGSVASKSPTRAESELLEELLWRVDLPIHRRHRERRRSPVPCQSRRRCLSEQ
jgi:hypothetical protein